MRAPISPIWTVGIRVSLLEHVCSTVQRSATRMAAGLPTQLQWTRHNSLVLVFLFFLVCFTGCFFCFFWRGGGGFIYVQYADLNNKIILEYTKNSNGTWSPCNYKAVFDHSLLTQNTVFSAPIAYKLHNCIQTAHTFSETNPPSPPPPPSCPPPAPEKHIHTYVHT